MSGNVDDIDVVPAAPHAAGTPVVLLTLSGAAAATTFVCIWNVAFPRRASIGKAMPLHGGAFCARQGTMLKPTCWSIRSGMGALDVAGQTPEGQSTLSCSVMSGVAKWSVPLIVT